MTALHIQWSDAATLKEASIWDGALQLQAVVSQFSEESKRSSSLFLEGAVSMALDSALNVVVTNIEVGETYLSVEEFDQKVKQYYLPPLSGFCISNNLQMPEIVSHCQSEGKFDLVVIDPPWPNKSASRSSAYPSLDIYELFQIPLNQICKLGSGLVAIWVTNRPKFRRFVKNKYFIDNGITLLGEWFWIKLAQNGLPVFDLDGLGRKPYEGLIIGVAGSQTIPLFPSWKVFASFALGHSQKPYIEGQSGRADYARLS